MKKMMALFLAGMMILGCAGTAFAKEINVTVDGKTVGFTDAKPYIDEKGRTMVPLRPVADAMGIDVEWDRRTKTADKPKVVQFRNSSYKEELGLYVSKPKSFSECQDISDILVGGTAVVINLEGFDDDIAQRIMDFVSGTVYAINGTLNTIATRIYLVSPESVSISGDVETILSQSIGGNAPTISKGF